MEGQRSYSKFLIMPPFLKLKKLLVKLEHELGGLQSTAKALGKKAGLDFFSIKKRTLSAARREKLRKLPRSWAKIRAQAKKVLPDTRLAKGIALDLRRPDKKNNHTQQSAQEYQSIQNATDTTR